MGGQPSDISSTLRWSGCSITDSIVLVQAAFNTGDDLADIMSGDFVDNHEVEDDLLSQYGLVEGEVGGSESQNTPWGGEAVIGVGEGTSASLPASDQVQNTLEQDKKMKAEQLGVDRVLCMLRDPQEWSYLQL